MRPSGAPGSFAGSPRCVHRLFDAVRRSEVRRGTGGAFLGGSGGLRAVTHLSSWWPACGRLSPESSNDA